MVFPLMSLVEILQFRPMLTGLVPRTMVVSMPWFAPSGMRMMESPLAIGLPLAPAALLMALTCRFLDMLLEALEVELRVAFLY